MRKASTFSLLIFMLLTGTAFWATPLAAETVEEVVNPRSAAGGWVTDGGGVLGTEYIRLIDGICRELQAKTAIELAVVTVGDLGGLTIDDFAEKLFRRFAIGAAGKDNGLLLLCSRDDRAVRIEVGYGLEGAVTDAQSSRLLDANGVPYLGQGQFGRGLFLTARELARVAAASDGVVLNIADPSPWPEQVKPPAPLVSPKPLKKKGWDPLLASLYFALGLLVLTILGFTWILLRFNKARGKAARAKVIGQAIMIPIFVGIAAVIGFFLILGFGKSFSPAVRGHAGRAGAGHRLATAGIPFPQAAPGRLPSPLPLLRRNDGYGGRQRRREVPEQRTGGRGEGRRHGLRVLALPALRRQGNAGGQAGQGGQVPAMRTPHPHLEHNHPGGGHERAGRPGARHRKLPQPQVQLQQAPRARHAAPRLPFLILTWLVASIFGFLRRRPLRWRRCRQAVLDMK